MNAPPRVRRTAAIAVALHLLFALAMLLAMNPALASTPDETTRVRRTADETTRVRRTAAIAVALHLLFALAMLLAMNPALASTPDETTRFMALTTGRSLAVLAASWTTLGAGPIVSRGLTGLALGGVLVVGWIAALRITGSPPAMPERVWRTLVLGCMAFPFAAAVALGLAMRLAGWRWIVAPPFEASKRRLSVRDLLAATAFLALSFAAARHLLGNYNAIDAFQRRTSLLSQLGLASNELAFALAVGVCSLLSCVIAAGVALGPRTHPASIGAAIVWAIGSPVGWMLLPPSGYALEGSAVLGGTLTLATLLALRAAGARIERPGEPILSTNPPTTPSLGE